MTREPSNDYLWDGSGEPDMLVSRLEDLLARFRYVRPMPLMEDDDPRNTDDEFWDD